MAVDYRSRPLYISYLTDDFDSREVQGLVSLDSESYFIGLDGQWYDADDQSAQDMVNDTSLLEVKDEDKIIVVNTYMGAQGIGADGISNLTVEELLP